MENSQHEQYEYARQRLIQKKRLYYHFVFFILISIFSIIVNKLSINVKYFVEYYELDIYILLFLI